MQGSPPSLLCPPFKQYKMINSYWKIMGEVIGHLYLTHKLIASGNAIPVSSWSSLSSKDDVKSWAVHSSQLLRPLASGADSPPEARGMVSSTHSNSPPSPVPGLQGYPIPASVNSSKSSLNFPEAAASFSTLAPGGMDWPADWFRSGGCLVQFTWASWKGFSWGNCGNGGHYERVFLSIGRMVDAAEGRQAQQDAFLNR